MDELVPKLVGLGIDAVPQRSKVQINENLINPKFNSESLVDGFSEEDYKSAFFLLMDQVGPENFMNLTSQDLPHLKAEFIKICRSFKDESILIELFGTLKMYNKLKLFGTCFHIFESNVHTFDQINEIWKVLFMICEEMTDEDVKKLKQMVPENFKNRIQSAEDWFCWALNENIFSKTDLSHLETIFKGYPSFLNKLNSLKDFEVYSLKVPSSSSPCGIALILNYEEFKGNPELEKRKNSDKDVAALKELWKLFGFETKVYSNLTHTKTFEIMRDCASADHSSYDAFVCCIMSHGRSNAVYSHDGYLMEITEIIKPILNDCTTLQNKPKLFFIQACQGTFIHQGAGKPIYNIPDITVPVQKCEKAPPAITMDTVISISSIDGYVSYRDHNGSWYIQTLCDIMKKYGDNSNILDILMMLNKEISKRSANFGPFGPKKALQIPEYRITLRKKLILKKYS